MKLYDYFQIISRLSPGQVYHRVIKIFKYKLLYKNIIIRKLLYRDDNHISINDSFNPVYNNYKTNENKYKADFILNNKFNFLNIEKQLNNIRWSYLDDKPSLLWLYELNYFNYGVSLIEQYERTKQKKYIAKLIDLMILWVDNTYVGQEISWAAYPISLRVINWINYIYYLNQNNLINEKLFNKIIKSIYLQTDFLFSNLEIDLNNNHLTSNAQSLIFAGLFFESNKSKKWFKKGIEILETRMDIEILNDGFHDERSSSYHMVTIKNYLEIFILLKKNNIENNLNLENKIENMLNSLMLILRSDMKVPLLSDSVSGYPLNARELMAVGAYLFKRKDFKYCSKDANLDYLKRLFGKQGIEDYLQIVPAKPSINSCCLSDAGYVIIRTGWQEDDTYLNFNVGSIRPLHCPGHGHSDDLSFELYAAGISLIVDPGVYSYHHEKYRNYFRSTRSHNTISINKKNKSKLLNKFRVAKIGETRLVNFEEKDEYYYVEGVNHDYKGNTHARKMYFYKKNKLIIEDVLDSKRKKENELELFLNLSPYLKRFKIINKNKSIYYFDNLKMIISFKDNKNKGEIKVKDCYISQKWNQLLESKKLVYKIKGKFPIKIKTTIEINKL